MACRGTFLQLPTARLSERAAGLCWAACPLYSFEVISNSCLQPRALNYGAASPPKGSRLQREASLARSSPSGPAMQPSRLGSTPARTPARQTSRFGHQQQQADAAAASAADGGALTDASDNIRVVLRVRPRNDRESTLGGGVVVQPVGSSAVRVASHPEPHTFSFDYVAGDATNQETIFTGAAQHAGMPARMPACCVALPCCRGARLAGPGAGSPSRRQPAPRFGTPAPCPAVTGKPIVDNCLAGYNGCICAPRSPPACWLLLAVTACCAAGRALALLDAGAASGESGPTCNAVLH